MTHNFMTLMARDALSPIAPENDLLLQIKHTEACGQALKHAATDLRIIDGEHAAAVETATGVIGKSTSNFSLGQGKVLQKSKERSFSAAYVMTRSWVWIFREFYRHVTEPIPYVWHRAVLARTCSCALTRNDRGARCFRSRQEH